MTNHPNAATVAAWTTQQKAIYMSLISIFTEIQAVAALEKWSIYFSDSGSVFDGLNNFAHDICKTYGKDDEARNLVRALNRALILKDKVVANSDLTKANLTLSTKSEQTSAKGSADDDTGFYVDQTIDTPDFQTFQALFLHILDAVDQYNQDVRLAVRPFLNELIESMPWSEVQQQQLFILIDSGTTTQMRAYKPDQLKAFLKHLRSWMGDEMDAKEADKLLKQAVNKTEKMPVAAKYSAKNFI